MEYDQISLKNLKILDVFDHYTSQIRTTNEKVDFIDFEEF